MLSEIGNGAAVEMSIKDIMKLISLINSDPVQSEHVWDSLAIAESVGQCASMRSQEVGYVYVDRERDLKESRRETQGVLTGGEAGKAPADHVTLFLLRTKQHGLIQAAWWPQVRFPAGQYAFAFAV